MGKCVHKIEMPRLMTIHHTGILSIVQGTDVATDALFCSRKYCHV